MLSWGGLLKCHCFYKKETLTDLALMLNHPVTTLNKEMGVSQSMFHFAKGAEVCLRTYKRNSHARESGGCSCSYWGVTTNNTIEWWCIKWEREERKHCSLQTNQVYQEIPDWEDRWAKSGWILPLSRTSLLHFALWSKWSRKNLQTCSDRACAASCAEFTATPAEPLASTSSVAAVYPTLFCVVNVY